MELSSLAEKFDLALKNIKNAEA